MSSLRGLNQMQRRLFLLEGLVILCALTVGARLFLLQVVRHGDFERRAARQQFTPKETQNARGVIQDRQGGLLAMNIDLFNVFVHPRQVEDKSRAAAALATALGESYPSVLSKLTSGKSFVWLARGVPYERSRAVEDLKIKGVEAYREQRRFYPDREMASHVLGFVGMDHHGLGGLELQYDQALAEKRGLVLAGRDARGRIVPSDNKRVREGADGLNLVTTLDRTIQHLAQVELEKAFVKYRCKAASIVVMDPHTGEVLALANFPTFDPNRYKAYSPEVWKDRVVNDQFEPGSTFKLITAAAALEEGLVDEEEKFFCENGAWRTDHGRLITDHEKHGWLTFREVFGYSSNIGMVKLGAKLGKRSLYEYCTRFGFGEALGVDLPGEAKGLVRPVEKWSGLSMSSIPFGYEISSSPLQVVAAYSAIANGGVLMKPLLARRLEDPKGNVIKTFEPAKIKRACSAKTAKRMTELMKWVVEKGTGTAVALPAYPIAGKTGTAYKHMGGKYSRYNYVSSFVGFVPADDPKYVIYISLDDPRGLYWGGYTAGPVFKEVAKRALAYAMVPGKGPEEPIAAVADKRTLPSFVGLTRKQVDWLARRDGLKPKFEGKGPKVAEQSLRPGSPLMGPDGRKVKLTLSLGEPEAQATQGQMPELRGKTKRQALALLAPLGLKVNFRGRGVVTNQFPPAGRTVPAGGICDLNCDLPVTRAVAPPQGGAS